MAMEKVLSPSGWDWPCPVASFVKLDSAFRMGANDRRDFVKRAGVAGCSLFSKEIERVKFAKDEIPVHVIALGASEAWGPNRNGDAFSEATLKESHSGFVKDAHWFRNHKNKKAQNHPHYGVVKLSAYNPEMRRVELIVGLPATEKAAELLGCNGPADKELDELSKTGSIAVSMACRVPYDVCSGCGNKAKTLDEYCKEASCKYGGCTNNLTKLVKTANDVHLLHVVNVQPRFFDISKVFRPADRTAYGSKADWIKAANDGGYFGVGGAATAASLNVTAPIKIAVLQDASGSSIGDTYVKLAYGLAGLEDDVPPKEVLAAFARKPAINFESLGLDDATNTVKFAGALAALADKKIILPLRDFATITKRASLAPDAVRQVRGVYGRLLSSADGVARLRNNKFSLEGKVASFEQRNEASRYVSLMSLDKKAVDSRCVHNVCAGLDANLKNVFELEKVASVSNDAEELLKDYACYKVAALARIAKFDEELLLTARLSACQNYVM
jgi:hypothetical protein